MAALLIARFDGEINELMQAYDRAHALVMSGGGATSFGELRHHCAVGNGALYIVGVWQSEEQIRSRWSSHEFEEVLVSVGFRRRRVPTSRFSSCTRLNRRCEPHPQPRG
jgi:hypothetical protein